MEEEEELWRNFLNLLESQNLDSICTAINCSFHELKS